MAKNDILFLGGLAALAYFLMQNNTSGAAGGGGGGGGETPPEVPTPSYTPTITAEERAAYPKVTQDTQAAIDAGTLNIFAQPQSLTPPGASSTKFVQEYVAKQTEAQAITGSANIASPQNLLAGQLPALYGKSSISAVIQSAAKAASAKAQSEKNRTLRGYYVNGVWTTK